MKVKHARAMMAVATAMSQLGTCARLQVGAIIHDDDGHVLANGYNGAARGLAHCTHKCTCPKSFVSALYSEHQPTIQHHKTCKKVMPCTRAVHAEANAVADAARRGVVTRGMWCTVTHSPCVACANLLVQCGVNTVLYIEEYRSREGIELMLTAGVLVWRASDIDT